MGNIKAISRESRLRYPVIMSLCVVALCLVQATILARAAEHPGKRLAFEPTKGNCLACHAMPTLPDAVQPGNSGPPLIAMSARFPNVADLRAKIWDATASKPDSFMPPFGKHRILDATEINQIVEFIHGL
jgi:sulfur-oxidizing protein SoxX